MYVKAYCMSEMKKYPSAMSTAAERIFFSQRMQRNSRLATSCEKSWASEMHSAAIAGALHPNHSAAATQIALIN